MTTEPPYLSKYDVFSYNLFNAFVSGIVDKYLLISS